MIIRRMAAVSLIVALTILFTACTLDPGAATNLTTVKGSGSASTTRASLESKRQFAVVFPIAHPFFDPIGQQVEKLAWENNWDVAIRAPNTADAQIQISIMENLIAAKVDGIAIGPTDPTALVPVINKAIDAGIKVICFETDAPVSKRMAYIGTDNYKAGRHMGDVIGRSLNGKGKILIMTGLSAQQSLNERIRGIRDFLRDYVPDIQIIDQRASEGNIQKAVSEIESMIRANPDFDAFIGIDAMAGPAAVTVWKAKGWQDHDEKKILTFNDMPENLQGMRDGFISLIVAQRQNSWGKAALDTLNGLLDGRSMAPYQETGTVEVTLDNIGSYMNEPSYVFQPR